MSEEVLASHGNGESQAEPREHYTNCRECTQIIRCAKILPNDYNRDHSCSFLNFCNSDPWTYCNFFFIYPVPGPFNGYVIFYYSWRLESKLHGGPTSSIRGRYTVDRYGIIKECLTLQFIELAEREYVQCTGVKNVNL